ncbi:MFS transporter [Paenibacillus sp. XY044]|nr:MFS transporter [Paenibacillus sp. XY044]
MVSAEPLVCNEADDRGVQEPFTELQRPQAKNDSSSRGQVVLFISVVFLYWFSSYIYVPILSPYIEHLGASYTYLGIVLGSYGLMQILFRLPLGILSDFMEKRRPFIWLGLAASALSGLMFAASGQLGWALTARAMAGIAASTWVVFTVAFSGFFPKHEVTRAMSMMQFTTVTAQLTSMLVSGYLVERWSWQLPFWLGGIVAVVALVLALFLREKEPDPARVPMTLQDLAPVMRDRTLFRVSFLSILAHCVLFITMFGYTPNQALDLGASKNDLAWLTLSFMLPHAAATLFAGRTLVSRFGERAVLTVGYVGTAVFTFCIPVAPSFGWLCVTQIFNGLAQGLVFPLLLGKSVAHIEPSKRATAMGFYQAVYAIGMFMGPFIAGWISSAWGLAGGFRLAAYTALAAGVLAFWWIRAETKAAVSAASGKPHGKGTVQKNV